MLSNSEIFSTINMIRDQKLDIRTITMGISLLSCAGRDTPSRVYDLITRRAERLVPVGEAIEREFGRIRAKKPGVAELKRTKEYLIGNFRLGLEQVRSRLFFFGNCVQTYGRILPPEEVVAGIAAVTADDMLAIANEILQEKNKSVSWVVPKK